MGRRQRQLIWIPKAEFSPAASASFIAHPCLGHMQPAPLHAGLLRSSQRAPRARGTETTSSNVAVNISYMLLMCPVEAYLPYSDHGK